MSSSERKPLVVPDSIEAVLGWKSWDVNRETGHLCSPSYTMTWEVREAAQAQCMRQLTPALMRSPKDPHGDTPAGGCRCGIYIAMHATGAFGYGGVLGRCYGWGTVIQHSMGWRVEYAYPKELIVSSEWLADFLSQYGVPVRVYSLAQVRDLLNLEMKMAMQVSS